MARNIFKICRYICFKFRRFFQGATSVWKKSHMQERRWKNARAEQTRWVTQVPAATAAQVEGQTLQSPPNLSDGPHSTQSHGISVRYGRLRGPSSNPWGRGSFYLCHWNQIRGQLTSHKLSLPLRVALCSICRERVSSPLLKREGAVQRWQLLKYAQEDTVVNGGSSPWVLTNFLSGAKFTVWFVAEGCTGGGGVSGGGGVARAKNKL